MKVFKDIFFEVFHAVIPLASVVFVLQLVVVGSPRVQILQFLVGLLFVILGLFLFMVGLRVGILPIGEAIGSVIPQAGKLSLIIFYIFLLGFLVTAAEPDVRVLASQVDTVSGGEIPHLLLTYTVALGVGLFLVVSLLKVVFNLSLKYLLIIAYIGVFILAMSTPETFVPISFDAGGVTTGPLTAPFVIALGVGTTAVLESKERDRFGFVALASIGPILGVLILGVLYG